MLSMTSEHSGAPNWFCSTHAIVALIAAGIFMVCGSVCAARPIFGEELWRKSWPVNAPLDIEWLGSVREGSHEIRILRYTGSISGGRKQRIYALYGAPHGASANSKVPAVVQIHGGGQTCEPANVAWFVDQGYACLAFNWGGVRDGRTAEETTDWSGGISVDYVDQPVLGLPQTMLYHAVLAARRAVDVLQERPEVDAARIGLQGISWGGLLAWVTGAVEPRLKAVVPVYGAGGIARAEKGSGQALRRRGPEWTEQWVATFDPARLAPVMRAPVLFCNGSNDWFGTLRASEDAMNKLEVAHLRSYAANRNHSLDAGNVRAAMDWFDHYLKGSELGLEEPKLTLAADRDGRLVARIEAGRAAKVNLWVARGRLPDVVRCWLRSPAEKAAPHRWIAPVPVRTMQEPVSLMAEAEYEHGALVHSRVVFDFVPASMAGVRHPLAPPEAVLLIAAAGETDAWTAETSTDFPACAKATGVVRRESSGRGGVVAEASLRGGFRALTTRRPSDPAVRQPSPAAIQVWTLDMEEISIEINRYSSRLPGVSEARTTVKTGPGWTCSVVPLEHFTMAKEDEAQPAADFAGRVYDITISGQPSPTGTPALGEVSWVAVPAR